MEEYWVRIDTIGEDTERVLQKRIIEVKAILKLSGEFLNGDKVHTGPKCVCGSWC